jgi:hypothetical protein
MAGEQVQNISVIDPITPAIERVKVMLFRPFDLAKWFTIGFCAWLAYLGQGGGGGGFNFPADAFNKDRGWHHNQEFSIAFDGLGNIATWFTPVVIAVIIIVAIIGIAIGIVLLWLSSRGKFMFLHCVATNKAEVSIPWHNYSRQGNSLFIFKLIAGIITAMSVVIIAGIIVALGFIMYYNSAPILATVLSLVFISLITFLPAVISVAVFFKFTNDFVVPLMFLHGKTALEGWREFLGLLSAHKGSFTLYILFQIVIAMALGILVFVAVLCACCACCCTLCIWMLTYIGTVALLPLLVFKLAYSLNYLRQFGASYDVFAVPAA